MLPTKGTATFSMKKQAPIKQSKAKTENNDSVIFGKKIFGINDSGLRGTCQTRSN